MKILRPLAPHLFGEFRLDHDVLQVLEGELLVSAPKPCADAPAKGSCLCARSFVGCRSGCATTLAAVSRTPERHALAEFIRSPAAQHWWGNTASANAPDHLRRVSHALRSFREGEILRLRWTAEGAGLYRTEMYGTSTVMAVLTGAREP